ncbi:AraC family transcriptional regulator [Agrobacterium sp.]
MSIAVVAFSYGFSGQAHLKRMFTAKLGMSPAQWHRTSR